MKNEGNATPLDQGNALWLPINLEVPLSEKTSFTVEPQLRWNESVSHANQQQIRYGINYDFNENLRATAGHVWIARHPNGEDLFTDSSSYENRLYQQVEAKHPVFKGLKATHRLRLEERLLKNVEDPIWYLRYRLTLMHPIKNTPVTIEQSSEFLKHLNSVGPIPSGLVQQRYFLGLNTKVSKTVDVDSGYLLILSDSFGYPLNSMTHALLLQVNIRPYAK